MAIRNPISNRASVLRTNLLMGLLENAAWNLNRGLEGVHIFEIGNVYYWGEGEKPGSGCQLGLLSTGLLPEAGLRGRCRRDGFLRPQGRGRGGPRSAPLRALLLRGGGPSLVRAGPGPGAPIQGPGRGPPRRPQSGRRSPRYSIDRPDGFAAEIDLAALFEKTAAAVRLGRRCRSSRASSATCRSSWTATVPYQEIVREPGQDGAAPRRGLRAPRPVQRARPSPPARSA